MFGKFEKIKFFIYNYLWLIKKYIKFKIKFSKKEI